MVVVLFLFHFTSCKEKTIEPKPPPEKVPIEVEFITVAKGESWGFKAPVENLEPTERYQFVITDSSAWQEILQGKAAIDIDFSVYQVLIVVDKEQNTCCEYRVEFGYIREYADKIVVRYTTFGYGLYQSLTRPFHIVKIPRNSKEIIFEHYEFVYTPNPFLGTWYLAGSTDSLPKVIFTEQYVTGVLHGGQEWFDNATYDYDYALFYDRIMLSHYPHHPEIFITDEAPGYLTTYSFKKSKDTLLIKNFWSLNPGEVYPSELTDILLVRRK